MEKQPGDHKRVSISSVDIDTEIVDRTANAWITVNVANHTLEEQSVFATIVVAQGDDREEVEVAEAVTPFGGTIEAVVRITDPTMFEADESGKLPLFDCLVGLEVEGEVEDVAAVRFDVS